jgi:hypothetical protein
MRILKRKESMDFVFNVHGNPPTPTDKKKNPDLNKSSTPKLSFREKLLGSTKEILLEKKKYMVENRLVCIELEDGNCLLPKVYLEPKVFRKLCTPLEIYACGETVRENFGL